MMMAGQIMIVMVLVIVAGEKMKITVMILAAIGSQMMNIQMGYVQLIRMHAINVMLDGTMLGAASDENGYYLITNVPIGSYTVKAMFIGYESIAKAVRVEADTEYIIDIALKPSAIELQETKLQVKKGWKK